MADSQVPGGVEALAGAVTDPAWKSKPSYYLSPPRLLPPSSSRPRQPSEWPSTAPPKRLSALRWHRMKRSVHRQR
ncbi:conserved protein of unknown function [Aminobacter niigataensis]|nr:conserved protein of unknown function [Aminobacter niigataensis]